MNAIPTSISINHDVAELCSELLSILGLNNSFKLNTLIVNKFLSWAHQQTATQQQNLKELSAKICAVESRDDPVNVEMTASII